MAEWLRRLTRNQMVTSRESSNLAVCVVFLSEHKIRKHKSSAADAQRKFNRRGDHSRSENAVVAEGLRRLTKNQKRCSCASSNNADCVVFPGEHKLENTTQVLQMFKKH